MTACLNAANERANELFRGEKLGYLGIPKAIEVLILLTSRRHVYMCMYACLCMHVCMCQCIYIYKYVCICMCVYVCVVKFNFFNV